MRQRATGDAQGMGEGQRIGVAGRPGRAERGLMHQRAERKVRQQEAPRFLPHQVGRLAPHHASRAAQMRLEFVEGRFDPGSLHMRVCTIAVTALLCLSPSLMRAQSCHTSPAPQDPRPAGKESLTRIAGDFDLSEVREEKITLEQGRSYWLAAGCCPRMGAIQVSLVDSAGKTVSVPVQRECDFGGGCSMHNAERRQRLG